MYVKIYKKQKKERKKLKKFFVIIGILLVIFISLLIYRKSEQKNIVIAYEVDNIQNYGAGDILELDNGEMLAFSNVDIKATEKTIYVKD